MDHRYASDCHTHSDCSFDGRSSMEAMCRRAEEMGLFYYTVSDHCECNKYSEAPGHETGYRDVAQKAWSRMEECRGRFPGLRFLKGIELGQPLQNLSAAEDALAGRDYDFILGSLHNIAGEKDFYYLGKNGLPPERWGDYFARYFRELLEMIRWGGFDSLAHLSYPLRYLSAPGTFPSFAPYQEELEAVLSALAQAGLALEMNTSRLLKKNAPPMPELEIFTCFRRMGGKLVTLGSDAHCVEDLAQGIDAGMDLLRRAGFKEFAVYVNRQPRLLPLE